MSAETPESPLVVEEDPAGDLARAQRGDRRAFGRLANLQRPALHAHCYRMLGSLADADDAVQETLVRAWRGLVRFEGRSTLRSWLFAVATRVCIDAAGRRRRVLPLDLGPPADGFAVDEQPLDQPWLDPYPSPGATASPEARLVQREAVALAVVAALQRLPARQRAALLLFDVVGLSAAEIARALRTSVPSVNSALQRAREQVERLAPGQQADHLRLDDARLQEIAGAFGRALEQGDAEALVALLARDVTWSMPPFRAWYAGLPAVVEFARRVPLAACGAWRHRVVWSGGEPAVAFYLRHGPTGPHLAWSITVLGLCGERISAITSFLAPALFARFGLPDSLD